MLIVKNNITHLTYSIISFKWNIYSLTLQLDGTDRNTVMQKVEAMHNNNKHYKKMQLVREFYWLK